MVQSFDFSIVATANDLNDAFEIYGCILNAIVKRNASATLSYHVGDETKILSTDNIKTGEGFAGGSTEIHRVQ